jgi:hypothetical protein
MHTIDEDACLVTDCALTQLSFTVLCVLAHTETMRSLSLAETSDAG